MKALSSDGQSTADQWTDGTLPMFGKTPAVQVKHDKAVPYVLRSGSTEKAEVDFWRAVARVDVGLNMTGTQFDETGQALTSNDKIRYQRDPRLQPA